MSKGSEIFKNIAKDMRETFKKSPEFADSAIQIVEHLAEIHKLGIDHSFPNRGELIIRHIDEMSKIIKKNFEQDYLSHEQVVNFYDSVQSMMDADKDYVLQYLDEMKEQFTGILDATRNVRTALDRACGTIPPKEEKKPSILNAIGNILTFRKKNDIKNKAKQEEFYAKAEKELHKLAETKKEKETTKFKM